MNNICFFIYNYLSSIIKNVFYRNKGEEEHNIISIDLEWENIRDEELELEL